MPSARAAALKKVFEEGVEALSKTELAKLFTTKKKLLRSDPNPKALMKKGFMTNHPEKTTYEDVPGIYFSKDAGYMNEIYPEDINNYVEGIKRPSAVTKYINPHGKNVDKFYDPGAPTGNADFLHRGSEVIQLKPNNMLVRYKDIYRILGLIGALQSIKEK